VVTLNSLAADELLSLAAAVEKASNHPLAQAIVNEARIRGIATDEATEAQQVAGQGITASVGGRRVSAGRVEMFPHCSESGNAAKAAVDKLVAEGKSVVVIAIDDCAAGVVGLADRPRGSAAETLRRLKKMGITRTIMLTGDRR